MAKQINTTAWKFCRGQQNCQMSQANKPQALHTLLMGAMNLKK